MMVFLTPGFRARVIRMILVMNYDEGNWNHPGVCISSTESTNSTSNEHCTVAHIIAST